MRSAHTRRDGGPPSDKAEVERLLRRGAHDILLSDDDAAAASFSAASIDSILATATRVTHTADESDDGASIFSKAAFAGDDDGGTG